MQFSINITDAAQLAGLADARTAANDAIPDIQGDPDAVPPIPPALRVDNPAYTASDEDYLTARVMDVLNSYAKQFGYNADDLAALEDEVAARSAKMAQKGVSTQPGLV